MLSPAAEPKTLPRPGLNANDVGMVAGQSEEHRLPVCVARRCGGPEPSGSTTGCSVVRTPGCEAGKRRAPPADVGQMPFR